MQKISVSQINCCTREGDLRLAVDLQLQSVIMRKHEYDWYAWSASATLAAEDFFAGTLACLQLHARPAQQDAPTLLMSKVTSYSSVQQLSDNLTHAIKLETALQLAPVGSISACPGTMQGTVRKSQQQECSARG